MFNRDAKERFIKEYLATREIAPTAVENVFNSVSRLEELYNKDVCNFTRPEIIDFYQSLNAKSKERLSMTNSILKEYKTWCIENGFCYDATPYFDTFTIDDFKNYISKNILENKYIGEKTLKSYLDEIINPQDQLLLVLLYNGIKGKQLCEVINLHVNQIKGNELHLCTGRVVKVDDSVIDLIRETDNTYIYYSYGDNPRQWELVGDKVFKNTKSVRSDSMASIYHRFTTKMVNLQKMFDNPELTINRVAISGMLNALKKEADKHNITVRELILSKKAQPILEQYQFKRYPTKVLGLFEEYFEHLS